MVAKFLSEFYNDYTRLNKLMKQLNLSKNCTAYSIPKIVIGTLPA